MALEVDKDWERIKRSLTNHPITQDGLVEEIENLRGAAIELAAHIIDTSEPSRERSLALTHLEEVVMWAVKSAILQQPPV